MQVTKFIRENMFFGLILLLAASLRFYNISGAPPSLSWDEVSHGYNAYSILKTGKDEWGVPFPTIFRAYGDYKLPVYIYGTALSEAVFGLNAFAVRLPSVLSGILAVLFTYLLTRRLFGKHTAVLAAILVTVEPWSLFLSRIGFEANFSLVLIVAGVYFFVLGLEKAKFLPVSALLFGLSVWTYNSARIFVPLLLVVLIFLHREELISLWKKNRKLTTSSLLLITFFFFPMFWQLATPTGQARYGWVAILDTGAIAQIEEARTSSELSPIPARLLHNKVTYFGARFVQNWTSHFTPSYLFFQGGSHYQQNIPGVGLLYPLHIVFFFVGLLYLLRKKTKACWLVLAWLLLSPVASSLTRDAPHVLRSIMMLPAPMVLTALGLIWVWQRAKRFKVLLAILYFVLLGWSLENYLIRYFSEYKARYAWVWQYGYKQAVEYTRTNYELYDKVIVTKYYGEPHEFFLFWWPWEPKKYQNDPNLIRFYQSNWYWVDRFDKFYFVNDWEIPKDGSASWRMENGGEFQATDKTLLITSPGNYPPGWQKLETVLYPDGKPAFDILKKI